MLLYRSQYINYNHLDQQGHHGSGAAGAGHHAQQHELYVHGNNGAAPTNAGISDPQFHAHQHMHYPEYDHYAIAAQYANSGAYGTTGAYINEYGNAVAEHRPESPSENSASPSPLPITAGGQAGHQHHQQAHNVMSSGGIAYLQAPYDEMPDYRITPSPGNLIL